MSDGEYIAGWPTWGVDKGPKEWVVRTVDGTKWISTTGDEETWAPEFTEDVSKAERFSRGDAWYVTNQLGLSFRVYPDTRMERAPWPTSEVR